jgi:hypothetical protein
MYIMYKYLYVLFIIHYFYIYLYDQLYFFTINNIVFNINFN